MQKSNRTAAYLVGIVALMVSLSFAAVPFYSWFCRTTGFAGTTGVAEKAPDTILDQTVIVRFDASTEKGMPWKFQPMQREMVVRIGENALAFYEATNTSKRVVAGTASYNVTPDAAGGYFDKIACFCFTEQVLKPGERVEMPVSFFVDPEMLKDPEGQYVKEITLSYTFFEQPLTEEQAALAASEGKTVN